MDKGDFFGEMSLFDRRPRSATVTTLTDCKMLVLTHDVFFDTIRKDIDIFICLPGDHRSNRKNDHYFSKAV